jgi:hypothetical protein
VLLDDDEEESRGGINGSFQNIAARAHRHSSTGERLSEAIRRRIVVLVLLLLVISPQLQVEPDILTSHRLLHRAMKQMTAD